MTVIINTQAEAEALIKDGTLFVDDNLEINCDISIAANVYASGSIDARNIDANNIDALNIDAWNIDAWNINAGDINAENIDARNIEAGDINAENIDARDISYYAVCYAHKNIHCYSIAGRRENSKHFCLAEKITIRENEDKQ